MAVEGIDRGRLLGLFLQNPSADEDFQDWVAFLESIAPPYLKLYQVPSSHILDIYRPRLEYLKQKSSRLAPGLSRAVRVLEAYFPGMLHGIHFNTENSDLAYSAWLDGEVNAVVAYFVSRVDQRY